MDDFFSYLDGLVGAVSDTHRAAVIGTYGSDALEPFETIFNSSV
jgi:hypothetical protein